MADEAARIRHEAEEKAGLFKMMHNNNKEGGGII